MPYVVIRTSSFIIILSWKILFRTKYMIDSDKNAAKDGYFEYESTISKIVRHILLILTSGRLFCLMSPCFSY